MVSATYCAFLSFANFYLFLWTTALLKCPFSLFALPGPSKKYGARGRNSLYKILLTYKLLKVGLHLRTGQCMLSVKYFFKHSRVYCLEGCRFISQILWIYHLEEGNLYMWVAGSILCLLDLLCNCFTNWNTILVFLKLWGTGQEDVFVFSWKSVMCKKPLREENVITYVQEQLLEPVYPHSWVSREGCKIQSL